MSREFDYLKESLGVSTGSNEIDDILDRMEELGYWDTETEEDE